MTYRHTILYNVVHNITEIVGKNHDLKIYHECSTYREYEVTGFYAFILISRKLLMMYR